MLVDPDTAKALPISCPGALLRTPPIAFDYLDVHATGYLCLETPDASAGTTRITPYWLDDQAQLIEPSELAELNGIEFRDVHHRILPDLEAHLADIKSDAVVTADIWFALPSSMRPLAKDKFILLDTQSRAAEAKRGQDNIAKVSQTIY